jgi:hypothetical protein
LKKQNKILITVVMLIVLIISIDCIIGFTIGGEFRIFHLLITVIVDFLLTALSILFIKGKDFLKSKYSNEAIVLIAILLVVVSYFMYGLLNNIGADQNSITYDTKVEATGSYGKSSYLVLEFYDLNGDLQEVKDYTQFWIDDDTYPEEGSKLTIEEKQGGFGYKIYKILKVNDKSEG